MSSWILPNQFWENPLQDYRTHARRDRNPLSLIDDMEERRTAILSDLDSLPQSPQILKIVAVNGLGFFTYAYSIFSLNLITPMLEILYYNGIMPHKYEIVLNVAILGGAILGHLAFGFLADRYGRRRANVPALFITLSSTLGFIMSSPSLDGSMSFIG